MKRCWSCRIVTMQAGSQVCSIAFIVLARCVGQRLSSTVRATRFQEHVRICCISYLARVSPLSCMDRCSAAGSSFCHPGGILCTENSVHLLNGTANKGRQSIAVAHESLVDQRSPRSIQPVGAGRRALKARGIGGRIIHMI